MLDEKEMKEKIKKATDSSSKATKVICGLSHAVTTLSDAFQIGGHAGFNVPGLQSLERGLDLACKVAQEPHSEISSAESIACAGVEVITDAAVSAACFPAARALTAATTAGVTALTENPYLGAAAGASVGAASVLFIGEATNRACQITESACHNAFEFARDALGEASTSGSSFDHQAHAERAYHAMGFDAVSAYNSMSAQGRHDYIDSAIQSASNSYMPSFSSYRDSSSRVCSEGSGRNFFSSRDTGANKSGTCSGSGGGRGDHECSSDGGCVIC